MFRGRSSKPQPTSQALLARVVNLAELILDRAHSAPDTIAVRMGRSKLTFEELESETARVAGGLTKLGISRGDRVMLFARNRIEHLVIYIATARIGAVFVPIHESFQVNELEYALANAAPTALIADRALWKRLSRCDQHNIPPVRFTFGRPVERVSSFDELRSSEPREDIVTMPKSAPVLICYTSGSTDHPHPVARSHGHEIWNARTWADVWDYRPDDVALVAMPLSWVWGLSSQSMALLGAGSTVVLHRDFDPSAVLSEIERSMITLFAGTMSMITALVPLMEQRRHDLGSLRRVYRGGEQINITVARAFEALAGTRLIDSYATTEVSPVLAVDPVRHENVPAGSVGRLVTGALIRVVDSQGAEVARGEVGEALLSGEGVMLGYWGEPELSRLRLTPDGWFRSGDLVCEGPRGYYFIVGRSSDVIIRNGARIAPAEVESALVALPGVRDSVAVGIPDAEFGESIVAFVVLDEESVVGVDDIYYHLADRIARFKLPSEIIFIDRLPVGANGKRDRRWMKEQAVALSTESRSAAVAVEAPTGANRPRLKLIE
jgi:long-chain acyl-CoA synthetase